MAIRPVLTVIGLMSGTSMDGVDAAILQTDGDAQLKPGATCFLSYSAADRTMLRSALADAATLTDRTARPGILAQAEDLVTERHAQAVANLLSQAGLSAENVDLIGFHGQTVLHRPDQRLTVQIGDGRALADATGIDVIDDFRAADVAAGGQGAPLVPIFHRALITAAGLSGTVAVVNIGGVANASILQSASDELIAGDTGPGNALLDDLMLLRTGRLMDAGGILARHGDVNDAVLAELLSHNYFALPLPKSLDRNAFSLQPVMHLRTEDALATLVAFTAQSIVMALAPHGPLANIIACGGGAKNLFLMENLARLTPARVQSADALGWSVDFMEAQAFAYLAVRHLHGLPLTYPATTGVPVPTCGGVRHVFAKIPTRQLSSPTSGQQASA